MSSDTPVRRDAPQPLSLPLGEAIDVRDELWNIDERLRTIIRRLDNHPRGRDVDGTLAGLASVRLFLDRTQTALLMHERYGKD